MQNKIMDDIYAIEKKFF